MDLFLLGKHTTAAEVTGLQGSIFQCSEKLHNFGQLLIKFEIDYRNISSYKWWERTMWSIHGNCSIPKGCGAFLQIAPDNIFKTNWTLVNLNIKKKHIETSLSSLIMLIVSESMVYHMSDYDNENIYDIPDDYPDINVWECSWNSNIRTKL